MRYLRQLPLLILALSVIGITAGPTNAQDELEHGEYKVGGPWNSHATTAGDRNAPISQPSKEVLTDFENIQITTSRLFQTECSIAINPLDSLNMIVAAIDGDFDQVNGLFVSRDGGLSWRPVPLVSEVGLYSGGDPWVTFDANGNAYTCGLQTNTAGNWRLLIHRSTDKGETWKIYDHALDYGTIDTTADEPVIGVDRNPKSPYFNSLYALGASDGTVPIFGNAPVGIHIQSRRVGDTQFASQVLSSQIGFAQVPHFTFGLNGEIFIAYIGITDILNLKGGLYMNASYDGGISWTADRVILNSQYTDTINGFPRVGTPAASRMGPTPRIVIDTSNGPRRGWMYVCYAMPASTNHKSNLDIFMQRSTDGGTTWSEQYRVNDDPITSTNDQLTPCMAINPDGVLGVVFYDRRDDPNNYLVHTYIAISSDGGTTWSNQRVSSAATDPMAARGQIGLAIADYISLAATRSAFFPTWNDGRTNNGDIDIYTARVPIALSGVQSESAAQSFSVSGYPNPFQNSLSIRYSAKPGERTSIVLYDMLGRTVGNIADGIATGREEWGRFDASALPAGAYLIRFESAGVVREERVVHFR